jgi:uncharacterized repeat protein (TIGR03803 family)
LVLSGNTLFGTTEYGGSGGNGTIFSVDTNGANFAVLHNFAADVSQGNNRKTGLALSGNTLCGMATTGGSQGQGTIFSLSTNGTGFAVIHNFNGGSVQWPAVRSGVIWGKSFYDIKCVGGYWGGGTLFSQQLAPSSTMSGIVARPDGSVTMNCAGYAGCAYLVQVATNLALPVWQTVSTNVADTNGVWQFTDNSAGGCPTRFYRLATP